MVSEINFRDPIIRDDIRDGHYLSKSLYVPRKALKIKTILNFAVRRKWKKYGRYIYFTGLLSYFIFLTFLTSFALLSPNIQPIHLNVSGRDFCVSDTSKPPDEKQWLTDEMEQKKYLSSNSKSTWLRISQYGIIGLSAVQLLLELVQFIRVRKVSLREV